jgi:hypothetical protein
MSSNGWGDDVEDLISDAAADAALAVVLLGVICLIVGALGGLFAYWLFWGRF